MALYILQPGLNPLGQFDFDDTDLPNVLGGELGVFGEASRTNTASEKSAADVKDGYIADGVDSGDLTATRAVLKLADGSTGDDAKAFYLLDDGKLGYGTLFGSVIGVPVGLSTTGSALGPHTASGSGKVTAWDKPGLYAVSLDAVYSDENVTNGALEAGQDTPLPGDKLYRHSTTGKLTRAANATNPTTNVAGIFIELASNKSLVTTPARLVGATELFDRVVFSFAGADKNL